MTDMTAVQMLGLVGAIEWNLGREQIPKTQVPPKTYFGKLSEKELLAHAHFLCDEVRKHAEDPEHWGKANRLFASLQMCLSFAGWYTLEEMQNMNRPRAFD